MFFFFLVYLHFGHWTFVGIFKDDLHKKRRYRSFILSIFPTSVNIFAFNHQFVVIDEAGIKPQMAKLMILFFFCKKVIFELFLNNEFTFETVLSSTTILISPVTAKLSKSITRSCCEELWDAVTLFNTS